MMSRDERAAALIAESGRKFADYDFDPAYVRTFGDHDLDALRGVRDRKLRKQAWDLYWLMAAARDEWSNPYPKAPPAAVEADSEDPRYP